ncbi:MAG: UDP-3-O-(3-hydroxymyristoyl)glucosamine N-acyltransferase [Vicinamibacteria bacterium]|nr:UDP-3-O-(3-hydroxymyristoyl)glucosamine N-acyltransferase [Vicinamibacteria bacterium]
MKAAELAQRLGGEVRGDAQAEVDRVAPLEIATPGSLSFLSGAKYRAALQSCRASVLIVSDPSLVAPETSAPSFSAILVVKDAYVAYASAAAILHPPVTEAAGIHPTAVVHPTARVDPSAHIGPFVSVGEGAVIGPRATLHPHVVLYRGTAVGEDTTLHSGVSVREGCRIGRRVVVHNHAVIGADGFGFARDANGKYVKIPQIGIVEIEDDVEIGALSAVDRASMGVTRIKRGTKLDNLVQIGHSVEIGEDGVICAQVGIAGSTKVGDRVILAGQVGVADHVTLGDDVIASARSGLHGEVASGARLAGSPAFDARVWLKVSAGLKQLPALIKRVRDLEVQLAKANSEGSDKK